MNTYYMLGVLKFAFPNIMQSSILHCTFYVAVLFVEFFCLLHLIFHMHYCNHPHQLNATINAFFPVSSHSRIFVISLPSTHLL